jgi:hypothetical protein
MMMMIVMGIMMIIIMVTINNHPKLRRKMKISRKLLYLTLLKRNQSNQKLKMVIALMTKYHQLFRKISKQKAITGCLQIRQTNMQHHHHPLI